MLRKEVYRSDLKPFSRIGRGYPATVPLETEHMPNFVADKFMAKVGQRVGRNDSCPCGSAKKFKKCCGR